jgi:hypothetical protein
LASDSFFCADLNRDPVVIESDGVEAREVAKDAMPDLNVLNHQLIDASKNGDVDAVKALIPQADPTFKRSLALQTAAEQGQAECVRLLIPVSDPKADNSYALQMAALKGHVECVRLLIPVSDPKADGSLALRWAANMGYAGCVALLLPVSDLLALDHRGRSPSDKARENGRLDIAGMIDAFIEAQDLANSIPSHPAKTVSRASI